MRVTENKNKIILRTKNKITTKLHGFIFQMAIFFIILGVRTSDLTGLFN
jgi:hypothetical protein